MDLFKEIRQGLRQAIDYEKGKPDAKTVLLTDHKEKQEEDTKPKMPESDKDESFHSSYQSNHP